ncbi:MAG: DUF456 domain-containing protein [Bacteroidales bacterium]|nr:DUF456 domain-containing protein [Bacteroidales bacterium]
MDWILLVLSIVLIIIGLIGCVLPVIPGPPISYIGLLILHYTDFADFTFEFLVFFAALTVLVTILDYVVPIWGTKKLGGSRYGIWGATIGLVLGIFFFPPIGIILGPFFGALFGELIRDNNLNKAFVAALGSLVGFLLGIGMKLIVSGIITYYFVVELF